MCVCVWARARARWHFFFFCVYVSVYVCVYARSGVLPGTCTEFPEYCYFGASCVFEGEHVGFMIRRPTARICRHRAEWPHATFHGQFGATTVRQAGWLSTKTSSM